MSIENVLHPDGTVTYWSVYRQQWIHGSRVPVRELAEMNAAERAAVLAHLRAPQRGRKDA